MEVPEEDVEAGAGSSSSELESMIIGFFDDMKKDNLFEVTNVVCN